MARRQPVLPAVWLVSDARNDDTLEAALRMLPRGSGLIFRHYHLAGTARRRRFKAVRQAAHRRGQRVYLSGSDRLARRWHADGSYGRASSRPGLPRLVTAHNLREIGEANRASAAAILLSPVFTTSSHTGARPLGPVQFRLLAAYSLVPVIALGGVDPSRARRLGCPRWAAIDGLSPRRLKPRAIDAESPPGA